MTINSIDTHSPLASSLIVDTSELIGLEKRIKAAIDGGTSSSQISKQIRPDHILWRYGAPMGVAVLMKHTPVGDNFSNWGYWDYGSYVLYGGDHAKGTLRRGWATDDPSDAENNLVLAIDYRHIKSHVERNVKIHRKNNTHYWCDLENCVPYAMDVEYGHEVVFPGEHKYTHADEEGNLYLRHEGPGGAWNVGGPVKTPSKNGWVPGKYFARSAMKKANWKPVIDTMHAEYLRRLRRVFNP